MFVTYRNLTYFNRKYCIIECEKVQYINQKVKTEISELPHRIKYRVGNTKDKNVKKTT